MSIGVSFKYLEIEGGKKEEIGRFPEVKSERKGTLRIELTVTSYYCKSNTITFKFCRKIFAVGTNALNITSCFLVFKYLLFKLKMHSF